MLYSSFDDPSPPLLYSNYALTSSVVAASYSFYQDDSLEINPQSSKSPPNLPSIAIIRKIHSRFIFSSAIALEQNNVLFSTLFLSQSLLSHIFSHSTPFPLASFLEQRKLRPQLEEVIEILLLFIHHKSSLSPTTIPFLLSVSTDLANFCSTSIDASLTSALPLLSITTCPITLLDEYPSLSSFLHIHSTIILFSLLHPSPRSQEKEDTSWMSLSIAAEANAVGNSVALHIRDCCRDLFFLLSSPASIEHYLVSLLPQSLYSSALVPSAPPHQPRRHPPLAFLRASTRHFHVPHVARTELSAVAVHPPTVLVLGDVLAVLLLPQHVTLSQLQPAHQTHQWVGHKLRQRERQSSVHALWVLRDLIESFTTLVSFSALETQRRIALKLRQLAKDFQAKTKTAPRTTTENIDDRTESLSEQTKDDPQHTTQHPLPNPFRANSDDAVKWTAVDADGVVAGKEGRDGCEGGRENVETAPLRQYAALLMDIFHDKDIADFILARADQIEEDSTVTLPTATGGTDPQDALQPMDPNAPQDEKASHMSGASGASGASKQKKKKKKQKKKKKRGYALVTGLGGSGGRDIKSTQTMVCVFLSLLHMDFIAVVIVALVHDLQYGFLYESPTDGKGPAVMRESIIRAGLEEGSAFLTKLATSIFELTSFIDP
ncbi:hypothetical protein BLNAU_2983 [Blattamonas nauphoetae]|uniref:Uncharacterized protein n=1 Tax=Blattamonas nauphoetae TaxID=2049346 RepID=A0ABQ9YDW9_9EUKA|nr:hypothetical protein BLNAU_2983 [Blattamonas nauphoetae]